MKEPKENLGIDPRFEHGYVIVRYDHWLCNETDIRNVVQVKKVVWDKEFAQSEVERLNKLEEARNRDIPSEYFWQIVRVEKK